MENTGLREKAEERLPKQEINIDNLTQEQIKEKLYELNVHQIELELQNDELRLAQQNLELKTEQYYKLFNNAPNGYAILDSNGVIQQANNSLQEIFSCELSNLLNKPFNSFLLPKDSNKFLGIYRAFFNNPVGRIFTLQTPTKVIKILGKLDFYFSTKIKEKVLFLTVLDVTEIEFANKQIEQDAKLYSSIIHNSLEGFWLINKSGKIIDANNTACEMLGYSKEELIGMPVANITTYKNSQDIEIQIQRILKLKEDKYYSKHTRKDKHVIDVEVCTSSLSKNGVDVIVAFIRDISQEVINEKILNKRIELLEYSSNHSVEEIMQQALDFAEELTQSEISFWHHISSDMDKILLQQWSTNTKDVNCAADEHGMHSDITKAGIWADCIKTRKSIVINDYQSLSNRNDLPEGHAKLERQLIVPIFKDDEIVAIIGVGNKKTDYVKEDIKVMETYGNLAWTIYEKQFTNESLVKSENKNKAILGLLPDLLFEISHAGVFLNYHASDYSKLFLPPENFIQKNIFDVLPQSTAELMYKNISKALEIDDMVSFEYASFVEEKYQYFEVRVVKFTKNSVLCFMRDITDKQVAKELIIESEEKFSTVFFNSPLIKSIIDIKTEKFIDINKQFIKATGFTKQEVLNHTASEIGLLSLSEKKKILTELDRKGAVRDLQIEYTRKNGSKIICNYSTELVKISGKQFLLNIAQDITEKNKVERELEAYRKDLENKVNERTKQLTELNIKLESQIQQLKDAEETVKDALKKEKELSDLKTQFISMASHEFRTPLTTIHSSAELIENYLEHNQKDKILHNSHKIQNAVNKMIALLEEVITLNRDKNVKVKPDLKPVKISVFIKELLDDVDDNLMETQTLDYQLNLEDIDYQLDKKIVYHILSNLLINAIKYSGTESNIKLIVGKFENFLVFQVEDNGSGINEKDLGNLFEPFYRSNNVIDIQGSGLGLTIAKSFTEMHGGSISVYSEERKGSTFIVKIPV